MKLGKGENLFLIIICIYCILNNIVFIFRKKRFIWTAGVEAALVDLWKKYVGDLRRTKHNGHVYKTMQKELQEATGTNVDVVEITAKIKNLTRRYRYVIFRHTFTKN